MSDETPTLGANGPKQGEPNPLHQKTAGDNDSPRTSGVAAWLSSVFGFLALGSAILCFSWTLYMRSVNVGENDFAGLAILLIEEVLLFVSGIVGLITIVAGVFGIFVESRKVMSSVAIGIGALTLISFVFGVQSVLSVFGSFFFF